MSTICFTEESTLERMRSADRRRRWCNSIGEEEPGVAPGCEDGYLPDCPGGKGDLLSEAWGDKGQEGEGDWVGKGGVYIDDVGAR